MFPPFFFLLLKFVVAAADGYFCCLCTRSVWTVRHGLRLNLLKCYFTSTETVGLLGTGAQDGHLDFYTAPQQYTIWLNLFYPELSLKYVTLWCFTHSQPLRSYQGNVSEEIIIILKITIMNNEPVPVLKLTSSKNSWYSIPGKTR